MPGSPSRSSWSQRQGDPRLAMDAGAGLSIPEWARFRWVVHVDGITCSSSLEKLLSLGSLVLREESGYRAAGGAAWQVQ